MVLREVSLGVNESLEVEDGEPGREVEVKELLIESMVGCDDRYGDSRPGQNKHKKSVRLLRWHRTGLTVRRRAGEAGG